MTTDAGELMALADEIENFEEVVLRTDDGPEWSDKRRLTDAEQEMIVSALRIAASQPDREAVADAFEAGALAVHREWVAASERGEAPPRGDPEFTEAARDYALSLLSVHVDGEQKEKVEPSVSVPSVNAQFRTDPEGSSRTETSPRFNHVMKHLGVWRNADHEDNLTLCRNDVIEIIEGVKLLEAVAETDADAPGDAGLVSGASSDPTLSAEGMREALEPFARAEYDLSESVADNVDIWETAAAAGITHGDIRRAKKVFDSLAALSALPVQSGKTNPHGAVDE